MKFDYFVHVKAVNVVEGEKDEYDFIAEASVEAEGEEYVLVYDENKGGAMSRTMLRVIDGKKVVLKREAEMCTMMTIEEGKRNISEIHLPFGRISMGVVGTKIESRLTENGGSLILHYITYTDKEPLGDMRFSFLWSKKGAPSGSVL